MHRAILSLGLVLLPALSSASSSSQVYLHPPIAPAAQSAGPALLAHHLGLEAFESLAPAASHGEIVLGGASTFVGKGQRDALLLSVDARHPEDVIPPSLQPSFALSSSYSPTSLLERYIRLAHTTYHSVAAGSDPLAAPPSLRYLDVFSLAAESDSIPVQTFLASLSKTIAFVEAPASQGDRFGAFAVHGLAAIEEQHGRDSDLYLTAAATLKATVQSAIAADLALAILVEPPSPRAHGRQAQAQPPPPQTPFPAPQIPDTAPVFSTSTCFPSADACSNATAACSSRGSCVGATRAGRTCFVCECGRAPLREGGRNVSWAGGMCQKKDISQEFTLIVGTVLFLILVVVGATSLLYSIGGQELPGTLTGGLGAHAKSG